MSMAITMVASAIFLVAFVMYNRGLFLGRSSTNVVSWALFSFITTVNSSSYLEMTGDWEKALVAFTDRIICYVTLAFLLFRRTRWQRIVAIDWLVFAACLVSVGAWRLLGSPTSGNLTVQVAAILAFVPIIRGAAQNPGSEAAVPWLLWTSAFGLQLVVVALRWEGNSVDLVNPALAMALHLTVGLLALRRPRVDPEPVPYPTGKWLYP